MKKKTAEPAATQERFALFEQQVHELLHQDVPFPKVLPELLLLFGAAYRVSSDDPAFRMALHGSYDRLWHDHSEEGLPADWNVVRQMTLLGADPSSFSQDSKARLPGVSLALGKAEEIFSRFKAHFLKAWRIPPGVQVVSSVSLNSEQEVAKVASYGRHWDLRHLNSQAPPS